MLPVRMYCRSVFVSGLVAAGADVNVFDFSRYNLGIKKNSHGESERGISDQSQFFIRKTSIKKIPITPQNSIPAHLWV